MAAVLPSSISAAPISGLARALLQAGRLSAQQADVLSRKSVVEKSPFIDILIQSGAIEAGPLAAFCSETFGYPMLDF